MTFVKVIQKSITVILYILLFSLLFTFLSSVIKDEPPNLFGYQMKIVLSGSMEPTIQEGSIIFIKLREESDFVRPGDVVTFVTEDEVLVTHRVVTVKDENLRYLTKGDANSAIDLSPVHINNIVGTYTGVTIPFLGYLFYFVTTKAGIIVTLIIPGAILLLTSLVQIVRSLRNETEMHL